MKPSSSFICLAVLASPAWTAPIEAHAGNRASSLHERQTNKPMVPDAVQVAARDGDRRPVSESRYANALKKMGEKMWRNPLKTGLFTAGVFAVPAFLTGVHVQRQKTLRERKKLWRETHPRRRSLVWEDRAAPLLIKRDDGMALEKRVPPPLETIFRVHEPVAQLFPSARQHELEAIEHAQGRSKKIKQGLKVAGAVGIAGGGTALAYWAGTRLAYMPKSEMERYNQSQEP